MECPQCSETTSGVTRFIKTGLGSLRSPRVFGYSGYFTRFIKTGLGSLRSLRVFILPLAPKKLLQTQSCSQTTLERKGSGDNEPIQGLGVITGDLLCSVYASA